MLGEMLGPESHFHRLPVLGRPPPGIVGEVERQAGALADHCRRAVRLRDDAVDHVHCRRADEVGDEDVFREIVNLVGRADLLDHPLVHHRDLGRHGHRLDLVVGDVDHGVPQLVVQLLDLQPHLGAELGVEVGERLVEEAEADLLDERAADRDALALAAGKLRRLSLQQVIDLQQLRRPGDAALDLLARELSRAEAEAQDSRAPSWSDRGHRTERPWRARGPSDRDRTPPAHRPRSRRRSSRAARPGGSGAWSCRSRRGRAAPEIRHRRREAQIVEDGERAVFLHDVAELDCRHCYPLSAPAVIPWMKKRPSRK